MSSKNMKTVQFVYSRCFLEIYSLIGKCGIDLKGEFLLSFKDWRVKKSLYQLLLLQLLKNKRASVKKK